jgi:hypothetical protein
MARLKQTTFLLLGILFLAEGALAQMWIERRFPNGSYTLERNPNYRCEVPAHAAGCERDPNICNGRNYCESSQSSRWTRWWHTSGTFRARGFGRTCAEARRNALQTLYQNESNLCGPNGQPTCAYGTDSGPCYHDGQRFVNWLICYNDRGSPRQPSNGAIGLLLYEILRRPRQGAQR